MADKYEKTDRNAKDFFNNLSTVNSRLDDIANFTIGFDSHNPYYRYFLKVNLNLQALITKKISVDLFKGDYTSLYFTGFYYRNFMEYAIPISDRIIEIPTKDYSIFNRRLNLKYPDDLHNLYEFNAGKPVYIEFSDNLSVPTDKIPLFIKMLNKSYKPYGSYKIDNNYKNNCIRLITGNKHHPRSVVIIYNKTLEVESRNNKLIKQGKQPQILLSDAQNVVRYEVKWYSDKLNSVLTKYYSDTGQYLTNEDLISEQYSYNVLSETANKLFPTEDFYNKYGSLKKINAANISDVQKKKAIDFIKITETSKSLHRAKDVFLKNNTTATFNSRLKLLKMTGIAPITISEADYSSYKIKKWGKLNNPLKKYGTEKIA